MHTSNCKDFFPFLIESDIHLCYTFAIRKVGMSMKFPYKRLIALSLALCLFLCGCANVDLKGYWENLQNLVTGVTPFDRMEYTRPDMDAFDAQLQQLCDLAAMEKDFDKLIDEIWAFYGTYDAFTTASALASIHYYADMSSSYWAAEHRFCTDHAARADAALDTLYRALAKSPLREELEQPDYFGPGYFVYYEGDGIYDEALMSLLQQEAALLGRYYSLCVEAEALEAGSEAYFSSYGDQFADLYLELVLLRRQIADQAGYEDYVQFAYDQYYYRDYSPQDATGYLADIRAELSPLYTQLLQSDFWSGELAESDREETFAYLSSMAENMGGQIGEAFDILRRGKLYDIAPGEHKFNASFEVYLPSYYAGFVFVNPLGNEFDKLTFCHEFGHFCSDYVSYGSIAGVDVAEIFSQGMEYLSLSYAEGGADLLSLKMADSLCIYVEQAALASFEQQVYALPEEELTADTVTALYGDICAAYGIDLGGQPLSYVTVTHFFTNPMYIISYVVSNDASLQLYQLEQKQKGAGLACLESNLATTQGQFLAFIREAGLESPFTPGRLTTVRQLREQAISGI